MGRLAATAGGPRAEVLLVSLRSSANEPFAASCESRAGSSANG